jgi:hypothetical protein
VDDIVIRDAGKIVTDFVQVSAGWNMVSVPLKVQDRFVKNIFPASTSTAFGYQKGYIRNDTLELATGYWLKFDSSSTIEMNGSRNWKDTAIVTTGWNMIGAIGSAIDSSAIVASPSNAVQSSYFMFDNSAYVPSTTLQPGKAYWVKSSQNGKLIMVVPASNKLK